MPVQFGVGPAALSLLGIALAGAILFYRCANLHTLTDMSAGRRRFALGLRLVIVTLVFLALAGLQVVRRNEALTVVFVADASRSIGPAQRQDAARFVREAVGARGPSDRAAVVTFATSPEIVSLPGDPAPADPSRHAGPAGATDLAAAIDAALALIPRTSPGKVVVLSDGNENAGHALAEAPSVTARGARLETVVLAPAERREALIEKLICPPRAKIGEPVAVRVILNALNTQTARLTLLRDGKPVGPPRVIEAPAGRSSQEFETAADTPGVTRFEAILETDPRADTRLENNRGLGITSVTGRPQILYAASSPRLVEYLRQALARQNIDVRYAPPSALPTTAAALQQYDSVVVSDVSRDMMTDAQLEALRTSVRDFGMGFAMVGGQDSFGLGGYRGSPVEPMLPVGLDIRKMQRFPPVAVALIIDRSGSMTGAKLDMARTAAIRAVHALKDDDEVAVVTFTGGADIQAPLTPLRQGGIIDAIQRIGEGGGTSVFSGAAAGFEQISRSKMRIRHMILLTDGQSNQPEDYTGLVRAMRAGKVTLSTVGIGQSAGDIDEQLLRNLAGVTGGRFYRVTNPSDIPRIYLKEIERISSKPLVEEPFNPVATDAAPAVLPGVQWGAMPPLLGYNVTEKRPGADTLVVSHRGDPIMAVWRYGLGRTLAFTSDDRNRWAAHWLSWPGYAQLWAQAVRWTMRSMPTSDFQTVVSQDGAKATVGVDAIAPDGRFLNGLQMTARVAGPSGGEGGPLSLPMRQTGPGHYETTFDAGRSGTYVVNTLRRRADGAMESTRLGFAVPYAPEYRDIGPNRYLMEQLARAGGGEPASDPRRVFRANRPVVRIPTDLAPMLLLAAMLLFPLDVAARRIVLQREDLARARRWLASRRRRTAAPEAAATPELARLKAARERARPAPGGSPAAGPAIPSAPAPVQPGHALDPATPAAVPAAAERTPAADTAAPAPEQGPGDASEDRLRRLMDAKRRAQARPPRPPDDRQPPE